MSVWINWRQRDPNVKKGDYIQDFFNVRYAKWNATNTMELKMYSWKKNDFREVRHCLWNLATIKHMNNVRKWWKYDSENIPTRPSYVWSNMYRIIWSLKQLCELWHDPNEEEIVLILIDRMYLSKIAVPHDLCWWLMISIGIFVGSCGAPIVHHATIFEQTPVRDMFGDKLEASNK